MKKSIFTTTLLWAALGIFAQVSKMNDARNFLVENNYRKAMPLINEVVLNDDTKNNPEAWYLRAIAYLQMAMDTSARLPGGADESYKSLMRAISLKPDYGSEINHTLYNNALLFFNDGANAYENNPSVAYDKFMKVVEIYKINGGKRFADDKNFTEVANSAKSNAVFSAVKANKDNEALSLLNELRTSSSTKDSTVYQYLIEIYQRQHKDVQELAIINEARTYFPKSQLFRNLEINYYIRKGQSDVLVGKLEQALRNDPNNPELLFNLANIYEQAAFPKNDSGLLLPKPANFSELFRKAETTYQKAINASPENPDYNYNMGVIYYETATGITREMNAIKGMSATEQKQYDALLSQRDAQFSKALPYFEKRYSVLDKRAGSLDNGEKITYKNVLIGLYEIYSRTNNKVKTGELKAKLDAINK